MHSIDEPWREPAGIAIDHPQPSKVREMLAPVPPAIMAELAQAGLVPLPSFGDEAVVGLLERSFERLGEVPGLYLRVVTAVRSIHILDADPGYDISHSEPRWRTSIFVSLPDRADEIGVLRLAESVVHEAMHLTLTNWETVEPFVRSDADELHSPWRNGPRPSQGVLHGFFVFVCIAAFLGRLRPVDEETTAYVARRLETIDQELGYIDLEGLRSSLTPFGRSSLDGWTGCKASGPT